MISLSKKQATRNRQIAEYDAILASAGYSRDAQWSANVIGAQLTLNTLLSQDDIDLLAAQLTKASDDKQRIEILVHWYDWREAYQKVEDVLALQDGYVATHFTLTYLIAKTELLRERITKWAKHIVNFVGK